jgi:Tfp pilus assembly protein PilX
MSEFDNTMAQPQFAESALREREAEKEEDDIRNSSSIGSPNTGCAGTLHRFVYEFAL